MSYNKKLYLILTICAILVSILGASIFYFDNLKIVDKFNDVIQRFSPNNFVYQIDNQVNEENYTIDEKVLNYSELQEFTANTPIMALKQNIFILPDKEKMIFSYLRPDGSTSSGFWFENTGEELNIYIYINPNSTDEEILFDLNRTYFLSLLYAAERWKAEESMNGTELYHPKFKEARERTLKVVMDDLEYDNYFITNAK